MCQDVSVSFIAIVSILYVSGFRAINFGLLITNHSHSDVRTS